MANPNHGDGGDSDKEANKNPDEDIESEQRPERGIIDGEKKQEEVSMGAGERDEAVFRLDLGSGEGQGTGVQAGSSEGISVTASREKVSYSAVVRDDLSEDDRFQPIFEVKDGIADISVPKELLDDVDPLWKCFVVGYFMSDAPHIGSIHSTVNQIWASQGKNPKIDVQFIGKKTVLFRVEDALMRNRILRRKYWHISDVPLVLNEWNPGSARALTDLSAMPLWVDLENVPGYLYSKKGISFLSRTAGKFVKLHPNTERCVRMDVARALVEVDLQKPLPQKICFKGRGDSDVEVRVSYPWLPPCCSLCSKWGHLAKECKVTRSVVILQRGNEDAYVSRDRSGKKAEVVSGKEVVSKLLEDLESIQTIKGKAANGGSLEVNVSANQVLQSREGSDSPLNGNWSLVAVTNTIPSVLSVGVKEVGTMNGFQALQDIREEGKIDEEDVEDGHEEDVEESELEEGKSIQVEERVLKGLLQTLEI
ncbi:BnaC08g11480D [Brassica napus]|uniref:BnaC08g11480D protein n=2 Tax=Brassica TaxID=3705 RepID=A0A078FAQ6_BRANA|nr:BnaC08g11480D [Brassica napus]